MPSPQTASRLFCSCSPRFLNPVPALIGALLSDPELRTLTSSP